MCTRQPLVHIACSHTRQYEGFRVVVNLGQNRRRNKHFSKAGKATYSLSVHQWDVISDITNVGSYPVHVGAARNYCSVSIILIAHEESRLTR